MGDMLLTAEGAALTGVHFVGEKHYPTPGADWVHDEGHAVILRAGLQLREYYAGERQDFDLVLAPQGTDFQRRVWNALRTIPFGETRSYGEIARQIGDPLSVRAVGAANGRNPISIVIPCHRVIGANGSLTGYAGGVDKKRALLQLEARQRSIFD